MLKCFVTGGTGFVGSHMVRLLAEKGYDVTVLVRKSSDLKLIRGLPIRTVIGDITDVGSLEKAIPQDTDLLFHNAAIMADWGGKNKFFPVNVDGTENILETSRKKDISRIIHTSSTAVYGFPNSDEPIAESAEWDPMNTYQKSKAEAEKLLWRYVEEYGFHATAVRGPMVLGEGDMFTGPVLIERIKDGEMVVFGGGDNTQTFVHGEDFARCLILAGEQIETAKGEAYNVGSFNAEFRELIDELATELNASTDYRNIPYLIGLGIGALAAGIYRAFGKDDPPLITDFRVKMLGSKYIIDWSKAEGELGYRPQWDLKSTARDMVEWGVHFKPR